ncbi:MAG: MBL fold metallo-hydrolase, partial [Acidobacteria bacterium]|nr:MBL fold metallo-hydrolase [Acidobacteriota bacterium]
MLEKDLPAINLAIRRAEAQIEQMRKALDLPADEGRRVALRKQLDERQAFLDSMSGMRIRPPIAVVERSLQIPDEVHPVEFRYLGPGHTDGDMVLYLPRDRIVFAGDVFFNAALPSTDDARMLDWIQTVVELLKIDADRFVPGHGPVAGRSEVEDFLRYLQDLRHLVEPYVQRGEPLEQVVREARLPERYAGYRFRNFFPANIKMMYSELRAIQLSAPTVEPPAADKPGAVPPMP